MVQFAKGVALNITDPVSINGWRKHGNLVRRFKFSLLPKLTKHIEIFPGCQDDQTYLLFSEKLAAGSRERRSANIFFSLENFPQLGAGGGQIVSADFHLVYYSTSNY